MAARKTGQMIEKGDGRWLLRWYAGRSPAGKRLYASEMFEGTTSQAKRKLAALTTEAEAGTLVTPTKQTVQQYLEWWLENVCKANVTEATLVSYTNRVRVDIYRTVGALKLHKLTWQHLQQVYNDLREQGKSGRTIQYTNQVLNMALEHAKKGKILRENPCDHASPGKRGKTEMAVWNAQEVQLFLERTQEEDFYPLWYTMLNTGLRPGEAFGLKWGDLQGDRLHIVRAVAETAVKGAWVLSGPKTEASKRSIALTKETLDVLQAHRKRQAAEILRAGPEYRRQDFIFATPNGDHQVITFVRRRWRRAILLVNRGLEVQQRLKDFRLYNTRHTHATLLLKAGVNPKVVQERLGHSSVVITLDTYSHVLPDMQDDAVGLFETLMRGAMPKKVTLSAR